MSFELDWQGGATERCFRKRRGGVEELPWGTLRAEEFPPELALRARASWTEGAVAEYATAAAFAELLGALLAARAPVDLVGMAGDFVTDEMVHVELNARMAMELGGAVPLPVDFGALAPRTVARAPALRAVELALRISCVGEAFSVPMLAGSAKVASHPLSRGVLERIARDEGPHALFGWLVLDWADGWLDDEQRRHLGAVALAALSEMAPTWQSLGSTAARGVTREGYALERVHALGWMESSAYRALARRTVRDAIVVPLARYGIVVDPIGVAGILDASRATKCGSMSFFASRA